MSASQGESSVLVDPAWISEHLDDPRVRLIEVDVSPAAYEEGHIPGAVFWSAYGDLRDADFTPVGREELERLLSSAGITPETILVVYGYAGALGFWLLKAHGHRDVRIMEGEHGRWAEAGGKWSTEVPQPTESAYSLPPASEGLEASREAMEAAIEDPGQILLDVRSELEYSGEQFWPSGASEDVGRAGHVPGAINVPIDLLRDESRFLRDSDELRRAFDRSGVTPDKAVIVYCTIGNRAAQAWFGLSHLLGYPDVRVYYNSWVEWGRRSDSAIEP